MTRYVAMFGTGNTFTQRSWSSAELVYTTVQPENGLAIFFRPVLDLDFCLTPGDLFCDPFSLVRNEAASFQNTNHSGGPDGGVPVAFFDRGGDETPLFYPASPVAAPDMGAPVPDGGSPNQSRNSLMIGELNQNRPSFAGYLAAWQGQVSLNPTGFFPPGVAGGPMFSNPSLDFPAAPTQHWFECHYSPQVILWSDPGDAGVETECRDLPPDSPQWEGLPPWEKRRLYWTMEFLQDSWAGAALQIKEATGELFGPSTASVTITHLQPHEVTPNRLFDSQPLFPRSPRLVANWKRLGGAGDAWAELHQADWQLNIFDLVAATLQSSTLTRPLPQGLGCSPYSFVPQPAACRGHMGGSIALGDAGNEIRTLLGNSFRVLSMAGHGADLLELYRLGPNALVPTEDSWSDNANSDKMANAVSLITASEDIMFGGNRDAPVAAILLPNWSAAIWNGSTDFARYDQEVAGLYFALAHNGIAVDFLDERDIVAAETFPPNIQVPDLSYSGYSAIYAVGPSISTPARNFLRDWAEWGMGVLVLTPGAATLNEYGEPDTSLYQYFFSSFGGFEPPYDDWLVEAGYDARARWPVPLGSHGVGVGLGFVSGLDVVVDQPVFPVEFGARRLWPLFDDHFFDNAFANPNRGFLGNGAELFAFPGTGPSLGQGPAILWAGGGPGHGAIVLFQYYPGSSYLWSASKTGFGPFGSKPTTTALPTGWNPYLAKLAASPLTLSPRRQHPDVTVVETDNANEPVFPTSAMEVLPWRCPAGNPACEKNGVAVVLMNFSGVPAPQLNRLRVRIGHLLSPGAGIGPNFHASIETAEAPPAQVLMNPWPPIAEADGSVTLIINPVPNAAVLRIEL